MTALTRRTMLAGTAAAAATAVVPAIPAPALAPAVPPPAPAPLLPVWQVGTPGEFDWQLIRAKSKRDALLEYMEDRGRLCESCPRETGTDQVCECCPDIEALRSPALDADEHLDVESEWKASWGAICDRCGTEEYEGEWAPVDGARVCRHCMTLAELQVHYPDDAADLLDELLTAEYGPGREDA